MLLDGLDLGDEPADHTCNHQKEPEPRDERGSRRAHRLESSIIMALRSQATAGASHLVVLPATWAAFYRLGTQPARMRVSRREPVITSGGDERYDDAYLFGDRARDWFYGTPDGPRAVDFHLIAIQDVLGPNVQYRFRAPVDPETGRPTTLIIEVDHSINDDDTWGRLVELQELLSVRESEFSSFQAVPTRSLLRNVVVVPAQLPDDWDAWLREIRSEPDV